MFLPYFLSMSSTITQDFPNFIGLYLNNMEDYKKKRIIHLDDGF